MWSAHHRHNWPCESWAKVDKSLRRSPQTKPVLVRAAPGHTACYILHPRFSGPPVLPVRHFELPERPCTASYVERTGNSNAEHKDYLFRPASKFEFSSAAPFSSRPKEAALLYHDYRL